MTRGTEFALSVGALYAGGWLIGEGLQHNWQSVVSGIAGIAVIYFAARIQERRGL